MIIIIIIIIIYMLPKSVERKGKNHPNLILSSASALAAASEFVFLMK